MSGRPSASLGRRTCAVSRFFPCSTATTPVSAAPPWCNRRRRTRSASGTTCSPAIYEAFLKKLSELDLPPISFVGHGIGLHLHEDPYLGKYSDTPLEAGMVLGIEPLVYRTPYGFGMQNKDMVLVTETGSELLSDYANTDKLQVVR